MIPGDFHAHTRFCDGADTVERMCAAAYARGLSAFGLSGHCYMPCDESYCMSPEDTAAYIAAVRREQARYKGKMEVLLGLEADQFGDFDPAPFDYLIRSVHCFDLEGFPPVDESAEIQKQTAERFFGGDMTALAKLYYRQVAQIQDGIVGHFDLITKFGLVDEDDPAYRAAALEAADALLSRGLVFEVNTGAITRGYRTNPYPARFILEYIHARNGSVLLSSDAHSAATICAHFDSAAELLRAVGFRTVVTLTKAGFAAAPLL